MKTITILQGSPRKHGNTMTMVDLLRRQLDSPEVEISVTHLGDCDIQPCIDCRGCKSGEQVCVVADDMDEVYGRLEAADLIVIGTPIYWFGPTAQTKLVLDRLRPYYGNRKLAGKSLALLLVAGMGAPDCDLTIEMFRRAGEALGMTFLKVVTAKAYEAGEVVDDREAVQAIGELATLIRP